MKHRPAKIWISEDQILAAIDRAKRKAQSLIIEEAGLRKDAAESFSLLAKTRFELMQSNLTKGKREQLETRERVTEVEASKTKAEAEMKAKAYMRITEKTLPRLGEVLAAFRTQTMPEILQTYKGVALK